MADIDEDFCICSYYRELATTVVGGYCSNDSSKALNVYKNSGRGITLRMARIVITTLRVVIAFVIAVLGGHLKVESMAAVITINVDLMQSAGIEVEFSHDYRCNKSAMIRVVARSFEPYVIVDSSSNTVQGIDILIVEELSRKLKTPYSLLFDKVQQMNVNLSAAVASPAMMR